MKFTAAIAAFLGAEAILAAPKPVALGDGVTLVPRKPTMQRRRAQRLTKPMIPDEAEFTTEGVNSTHASYSTNWAGAVLIGSGYKQVVGTITVPTPKVPSGGSSRTEYAASAWVGIDGDTCQTAILQTGVDFYVQGSSVSFDAWYEWFPDYAYTFSGFAVNAGNQIRMTASATSLSAGSVKIENLSTGKSVTHSFSGESDQLCEANAEWIVEDFSSGSSLVPFANFGTVTFSGCSPSVSGAEILDIKQNNKVLTNCGTSGSSTVTCSYTG